MPFALADSFITDAMAGDEKSELLRTHASEAALTLGMVKRALRDWQNHMRRAALLQSEDEFAQALALVPSTPHPAAYLARTLRGLADLFVSQGRLDEAVGLFERVAQGGGRLSERFWCDYATLLFRLGLQRIGTGRVALANEALARAGAILEGPAQGAGLWRTAFEGYGETALWFERAGESIPAAFYGEKALTLAGRLEDGPAAGLLLRRLALAGQSKGGVVRALHWLERLQALRNAWPEALGVAVQIAVSLAHNELALGRAGAAEAVFAAAETWLRASGLESLALADLHLGWGLALGPQRGRGHLETALSLRRRLLGPEHPRTREAEQALVGLANAVPSSASDAGGLRLWDGGARFEAPLSEPAGELKRLQRRLVRLCHPDAAPQQLWRHELMVRVNRAVEAGDVFTLRGLLREAFGRLSEQRKESK
jgi:tetratricopeptide (TPR) repeat protein